jgi:hypothetical protein
MLQTGYRKQRFGQFLAQKTITKIHARRVASNMKHEDRHRVAGSPHLTFTVCSTKTDKLAYVKFGVDIFRTTDITHLLPEI